MTPIWDDRTLTKSMDKSDFDRNKGKSSKQIDWMEGSHLTNASKPAVIKSNLLGISPYFMNWFKPPRSVCKEIDNRNRIFSGIKTLMMID